MAVSQLIFTLLLIQVHAYYDSIYNDDFLDLEFDELIPPFHGNFLLCIYVPESAATALSENNPNTMPWQEIVARLLEGKGIPYGNVKFIIYTALDMSKSSFDACSYRIYILGDNEKNIAQDAVDSLLHYWDCVAFDYTIYYYEQKGIFDRLRYEGPDCTVALCPLDQNLLGLGCTTTDNTTYENVSSSNGMIDIINNRKFRVIVRNTQTNLVNEQCKLWSCTYAGPRYDTMIIQAFSNVVPYVDVDLDRLNVDEQRSNYYIRINWRKWWDIFYIIVDSINTIINTFRTVDTSVRVK